MEVNNNNCLESRAYKSTIKGKFSKKVRLISAVISLTKKVRLKVRMKVRLIGTTLCSLYTVSPTHLIPTPYRRLRCSR